MTEPGQVIASPCRRASFAGLSYGLGVLNTFRISKTVF